MQRETENTAPPRAGRKEWIGLAVIALACVLYVMDLTVLHLAVPAISADLRPSSAELLWIIDIYGFVVAAWTFGLAQSPVFTRTSRKAS
jgi:DHA2 family multidrug resistance protein-like MFS transporter